MDDPLRNRDRSPAVSGSRHTPGASFLGCPLLKGRHSRRPAFPFRSGIRSGETLRHSGIPPRQPEITLPLPSALNSSGRLPISGSAIRFSPKMCEDISALMSQGHFWVDPAGNLRVIPSSVTLAGEGAQEGRLSGEDGPVGLISVKGLSRNIDRCLYWHRI